MKGYEVGGMCWRDVPTQRKVKVKKLAVCKHDSDRLLHSARGILSPLCQTIVCRPTQRIYWKYSQTHFYLLSSIKRKNSAIRFPKYPKIPRNAAIPISTIFSRQINSFTPPCRNRHGFSYALKVANQLGFLHTIDQRRRVMNTKTVVVHCEYSEDGKDIAEIIQESFRLFLQKELRTFSITTQDGVS